MKIARFFAVIFAVLGTVLMLGSAILCFASLDSAAKVTETPDGAIACADELIRAIDAGNLEKAAQLMYGQPDLGTEGVPSDAATALIWDKFRVDLACVSASKLYLQNSDFLRDIQVTVLDVTSITEGIQPRAKALLEQKVAQAENMEELYDAENNFRRELIDQVMNQALAEAMERDARYVTVDATVKMIFRDGQWWAVPDAQLLAALSGSMA